MASDNGAWLRPWRLSSRWLDLACAMLLVLGGFALYAATAVPGVFDGDYGELQYMPRLLGLPHPTGYPSFLLLGWLWSWLPLGTMAFRLNLFSAFWASLTLLLLYLGARGQGLKRIVALANTFGVNVIPHCWGTGIAFATGLHLVSTLDVVPGRLRMPEPMLEMDRSENPLRDRLTVPLFEAIGGIVPVPTDPGLGIDVDPDLLEEFQTK